MNVKKIFGFIIAFISGVVACILSILFNNRRTTTDTRKQLEEAADINSDIGNTIDDAQSRLNTGEELLKQIGNTIDENRKIIEEIRKQKHT